MKHFDMNQVDRRNVAAWLLVCCSLVLLMIVVGGATRLTHAGLSIVEWQPITGVIPPIDQADWDAAFEKYQATPEYQKVNTDMSIDAFKRIFLWEYFHRLFARAAGLVYLLPFLYFLMRGTVKGGLAWKLAAIFVLGGLQGAMGWYMVKSGLVDDPRVSQYRLTAHLGIAFVILGAMLWTALDLLYPRRIKQPPVPRRLTRHAIILSALIFLMALSGGLVAGIRAGLAYNTFPLMNGHVFPPELFVLSPWWSNFFNNMALVQFNHRLIAWLLILLIPLFWISTRRVSLSRRARIASNAMLAMLGVQVALGIATLLMVVPVPLAVAHQGGAALLFGISVWVVHSLHSE